MQLELVKNQNQSQSISFKDAPLPIQFAMAAKQGLIDPQIGQYAVSLMVQKMFPQLAEQMARQPTGAPQQQAPQPQQPQQAAAGGGNGQQQSNGAITQAALQSLMSGQGPAM